MRDLIIINFIEYIDTYYICYAKATSILGYTQVLTYFVLGFLICNLLIFLSYIFSLALIKDSEKLSEYECGFDPFDNATRQPFDVHFYIVGILFLIFDIEIALLFPWIVGLQFIGWYGFYTMTIFLIIITVGFYYEWHRGALLWPQVSITKRISQ
jgi:NADH-quinone oxidoreductase subunit A